MNRLREARTLELMIGLRCRRLHRPPSGALCPDCGRLRDYARERLARCPHGEGKPVCSRCSIHCYRPERREEIRRVMRFAGPRMLFVHPLLAIGHLAAARLPAPLARRKRRGGRRAGR